MNISGYFDYIKYVEHTHKLHLVNHFGRGKKCRDENHMGELCAENTFIQSFQ